jgi:cell wall assembly regulator SMI1
VKTIWDRIHRWLRAHAPAAEAGLGPGASEGQLRAAEAAMAVSLPEDVKACYRIHDGRGLYFDGCHWVSLEETVAEWRFFKDMLDFDAFQSFRKSQPLGPIRPDWWHPAWVPLTTDGSGDLHCLDLAPAEGGQVGQVILLTREDDSRVVVADSFTAWLSRFTEELEQGLYAYSPDCAGLVPVGDV